MRKICVFCMALFMLILSACSGNGETPSEYTDTPLTTPAEEVSPESTDTLSAVISAIGPESTFYATGPVAYYVPNDLLASLSRGIQHYGKTTLCATSLMFEYLAEQQSTLRVRLAQIDINSFELVEKDIAQEKERSGTFSALIENADGSTYRLEVYPCLKDGVPSEAIIVATAYQLSSAASYYCGPYDDALFDGLTEMFEACRVSNEIASDTARITFPGEATEKTLLRYLNARFINLVDGVTLKETPVDADTACCNIKAIIGSDEYWIDRENGVILRDMNTYQLPESHVETLNYLLEQAK